MSQAQKTITITHNGYHGYTTVSLRVDQGAQPGDRVEVSRAVARRLNNEVCGCTDCQCGECIARPDNYPGSPDCRWWVTIPQDGEEIRGRYPQD